MTAAHHRIAPASRQAGWRGISGIEWALLAWSLAVLLARFLMLNQTAWANGLDGYYYAEQILSYRQLGHFIILDNSPVLYFMAWLDFLVNNPILTTKLASALFGALGCLAIYYFIQALGGKPTQAWLAAWLFGLSPTLTFLSVDYIKNGGALVVFFVAAGWTARFFAAKHRSVIGGLIGLLLFALCFAAHRVGAVLLCLFVFGLMLQQGRSWLAWSLGAAAALIMVMVGLSRFKGGFLIADLGRLWPAFAPDKGISWLSETFRQALPPAVLVELGVAGWLSFGMALTWQQANHGWRALWPCAALLFLPVWDLSALDLGFRLQANGVALAICLLVLVIPAAGQRVWPWLFALSLLLLPLDRAQYRLETDPPFKLYQAATADIDLPADSLLICHPGLNNFYTYNHQLKDALAFLPEFPVATAKLWRLSHGVSLAEYRQLVPESLAAGLIKKPVGPYVLIREDAFQLFRNRCTAERRQALDDWFNPHELRPAWLLEKNR